MLDGTQGRQRWRAARLHEPRSRNLDSQGKGTKSMPMNPAEIEGMIKAAMPDAQVRIEDLRGDGDHYAAYVVSAAFRGKTRVQQHKMRSEERRVGKEWVSTCSSRGSSAK